MRSLNAYPRNNFTRFDLGKMKTKTFYNALQWNLMDEKNLIKLGREIEMRIALGNLEISLTKMLKSLLKTCSTVSFCIPLKA